MAAIGAIDIALWDIKGKAAELPVHALLGGPHAGARPRVLSSTGRLPGGVGRRRPAHGRGRLHRFAASIRSAPLRLGAGTSLEQLSFRGMAKHAAATLQAVRDAVGDEIDLMVDVVNRLTPPEAIEVAKALEPYGLFFFRGTPSSLRTWTHGAMSRPVCRCPWPRVSGSTPPTSSANCWPTRGLRISDRTCRSLVESRIAKRSAALAEASYVGVAPHNPLSCVLTAACVQLDAAIHNVAIQEYPRDEYDAPKRDLVETPLRREDGFLIVPQTPGIGIELNDEAFPHYPPEPYIRQPVIGPDGALRDY